MEIWMKFQKKPIPQSQEDDPDIGTGIHFEFTQN